MFNSNPPDSDLLKSVLRPLLEDFQYWFGRSQSLLEERQIFFLSLQQQADLLERVKQAQKEVQAAQMLFEATSGKVGIETSTLIPWHQLVTECWQVATRYRLEKSTSGQPGASPPLQKEI